VSQPFGALAIVALTASVGLVPHPNRPWLIWNASASVPIGLYAVEQPTNLHVADLVIVRPPEQPESFLADRGYLAREVPLVKHVLAFAGQSVWIGGRLRRSDHGLRDKAPTAVGRMWLVGLAIFDIRPIPACGQFGRKYQRFQCPERRPGDRREGRSPA
jgi:hypothetical protein